MLDLRRSVVTALLFLVATASLHAQLVCPAILGDHMVLQRDQPVVIWGMAEPGERVAVSFAGQDVAAEASADGRWSVTLRPLPASIEGRSLVVRGRANTIIFDDVVVGEVWLASGQSNMEKPFGPRRGQQPTDHSEAEIAAADAPLLRLYQVPHHGRLKEGVDGLRWVVSSPESLEATGFSAAAYVFGRELQEELGVPVGVIHASFGGTQIEAWIPPAAWSLRPSLAGVRDVKYSAWVEGVQASELWQSMIAPLVPYHLRGFLWYQGETNLMHGDGELYTEKMHALIEGWRREWRDEHAPFFYALLAPFAYSEMNGGKSTLSPEALPAFWEAQVQAQRIPDTGLIVTSDLVANVKDIHPTNKRGVGERFALLALQETYHQGGEEARAPQMERWQAMSDGRVFVRFSHVGEGLMSRDGQPLSDFALAGADRTFHPAQAELMGDQVILISPNVPKPVAARFGWHERAMPNLINSTGLPAVPFRTDDWTVASERPEPTGATTDTNTHQSE